MSSEPTPGTNDGAVDDATVRAAAIPPGEDEEPEPIEITHAPPRLSQLIAAGGIVLGTVLTIPFAFLAIPFGLSGLALFLASLFKVHSRGWLSVGTALVLVGALLPGAYGAIQPELLLLAVGSTVLAWDLGQHGISIGDQLGRDTKSYRLQLVHAAISAFVIGFISFVGYFVYLLMGTGRPAPAVVLIVMGIVLFTWMYRS